MEGAQRKCLKFPDIRNNIFYSIKKEKRLIFTARILLFVLFMGLWEMSTRCGWIDSFIFSRPFPHRKNLSFHVQGSVSVFPYWGYSDRNSCQFLFVVILGVGTAILLWCSPKTSRILEPYLVVLNSLPEICPCTSSDCMAGCQ